MVRLVRALSGRILTLSLHQIIDALIPYTERHYQHLTDLITRSYLMDFTLQSMELLVGNEADEDEGDLDALWKNRSDKRVGEMPFEKKMDGDALDEDDWEGSDLHIAEGSIGGDVDGEFVGGDSDVEMEDGDVVKGSEDEVEGSEDSESGSLDGRKPNGRIPNGHLPNGDIADSDDSEEGSGSDLE